jgi:hypothetical protein
VRGAKRVCRTSELPPKSSSDNEECSPWTTQPFSDVPCLGFHAGPCWREKPSRIEGGNNVSWAACVHSRAQGRKGIVRDWGNRNAQSGSQKSHRFRIGRGGLIVKRTGYRQESLQMVRREAKESAGDDQNEGFKGTLALEGPYRDTIL